MMVKKFCVFFVLGWLSVSMNAVATDILVWDKVPLEIRLEVGKETIIEFPDNIELNMPENVFKRLDISAAAGVAYVTPRAPFPKSRIDVILVSSNKRIFIDFFAVSPTDDDENSRVKIITKKVSEQKEVAKRQIFENSSGISIKDLIQYAAQDFFAPDRLKQTGKPIQETVYKKKVNLELLFMGRSAGIFDLKPIKQYRTKNYTLTAILLTNRTDKEQLIIYRDMYPMFKAVSSQHNNVGPKNSHGQSTLLYLVTDKPLYETGT